MIMRYEHLNHHPNVFLKMTGLRLNEFAALVDDLLPELVEAEQERLSRLIVSATSAADAIRN